MSLCVGGAAGSLWARKGLLGRKGCTCVAPPSQSVMKNILVGVTNRVEINWAHLKHAKLSPEQQFCPGGGGAGGGSAVYCEQPVSLVAHRYDSGLEPQNYF